MSDLQQFRVTVTLTLDDKNRKDAAMRAYSLLNDETPETFSAADAASMWRDVTLTDDEQKEALDRAFEGTLFVED